MTPARLAIPPNLPATDDVFFQTTRTGARFQNPWGGLKLPGPKDLWRWRTGKNPHAKVKRQRPRLPVVADAASVFETAVAPLKALWIGHASVLFEVDGRRVLVDPVFGRPGGVVPRHTPAAVDARTIPRVDVVCLTHGHHDHLDRRSLSDLQGRFGDALQFAVPLGQEKSLPRNCRNVARFDWWDHLAVGDGVEIIFVPAQHWHRRGLTDENKALWGGWVVRGSRAAYHSGDTGFFDGFGAIGRAAGPLDLAVLPLGAYEPTWFMGGQHMEPTDSVRAFDALGARWFLGMHWGTFDLSNEPLDEGPRVLDSLLANRPDGHRFLVAQNGATVSVASDSAATLSHRHEHPPRAE